MKKFYFFVFFILGLANFNNIDAQTHWYLRIGTGAPTNVSSWTDATNGIGGTSPAAGEFSLANRIWHFRNRTSASIIVPWNIHASSTASVEANINLTSSVTGSISGLVDIASNGTLTISNPNQVTLNYNNLDFNSYVVYNNANVKVTSANYGNLVIAQNSTLTTAASINVNGILDIKSGKTLRLNGNGLYLNGAAGSISNSGGTLIGDSFAWITLQGGNGGNNGTLTFAAGSEILDYLIILYSQGTDYIRLGSKLNITVGSVSGFLQAFGGIDLNGNTLTIESGADISFSAASNEGVFMGNSNSKLFIDGSVGSYLGTTALFMDPANNTLGVLSLNSASTLDAGNALKINDSLSVKSGGTFNTNNNVTLVSTTSLKGRLANISNGTISGNLTVQTFAKGTVTDWANLGVSGIQGQTFQNWYGQIPMAIEGSTTGVTSTANTYFESVQSWFENVDTYDTTITVTSAITPGKGYWVFLGTGLYTTTDMVWSVTGTPVTGNTSIPITNSGAGWNLIANPYPSPISWDQVMAQGGNSSLVNDAYYIYDADLGGTVSYVSGAATPSSYQTMTNVIPMGQAFYVEAIGAGNLSVTESCKSDKNTGSNQLLKGNSLSNSNSVGTLFRLNIDGGGWHDDAVIRFHSNATSTFDKALDARKLYNSPGYVGYPGTWSKRTVIATQLNNEDYSINSLPYPQTQNAVIPVIARVYSTGQYTISGSEIQNLPPNVCVTLKDNLMNVTQDLRLGDYICNIVDTTFASRFELTICADLTMDVKNISSAAAKNSVDISRNSQGVYVKFDYAVPTDATIYASNILGQTIMAPKKVKASNETMYLDINSDDQLIFVTVITKDGRTTKKILNKL